MMRVCHLNTCPVGVATQDPELRAKFTGTPEHVVNFMRFIAQEVREMMAQLGFRTVEEMVGRTDKLDRGKAVDHYKARGLDFSPIFYQPEVPADVGRYCHIPQDHGLDKSLDNTTLLPLCQPALERGEKVSADVADPQRQPRRRHDPRQRGDAALRAGRPAGGHDPACTSRARPARASAPSCPAA